MALRNALSAQVLCHAALSLTSEAIPAISRSPVPGLYCQRPLSRFRQEFRYRQYSVIRFPAQAQQSRRRNYYSIDLAFSTFSRRVSYSPYRTTLISGVYGATARCGAAPGSRYSLPQAMHLTCHGDQYVPGSCLSVIAPGKAPAGHQWHILEAVDREVDLRSSNAFFKLFDKYPNLAPALEAVLRIAVSQGSLLPDFDLNIRPICFNLAATELAWIIASLLPRCLS